MLHVRGTSFRRYAAGLAALVAAPVMGWAQGAAPTPPLDPVTHRITYSGVVLVPGATQQQLYTRALDWIANDSEPQDFAAQLFDVGQGKIIVREAIVLYPEKRTDRVVYTLTLYCKYGRYKYVASNITYLEHANATYSYFLPQPLESAEVPTMFVKPWQEIRAAALLRVQATLAQLQNALTTSHPDPSDF